MRYQQFVAAFALKKSSAKSNVLFGKSVNQ